MAEHGGRFRPAAPTIVELAAGAVVVDRATPEAKALLLHLADEDRWCLPKGHVEAGESLVDAALREVREETGLSTVRLGDEIAEVSYRFYRAGRNENVLKVAVYFLARTPDRELRTEPIFDRSEWVPLAEAVERLPFDTDRTVVRAAIAHLRQR